MKRASKPPRIQTRAECVLAAHSAGDISAPEAFILACNIANPGHADTGASDIAALVEIAKSDPAGVVGCILVSPNPTPLAWIAYVTACREGKIDPQPLEALIAHKVIADAKEGLLGDYSRAAETAATVCTQVIGRASWPAGFGSVLAYRGQDKTRHAEALMKADISAAEIIGYATAFGVDLTQSDDAGLQLLTSGLRNLSVEARVLLLNSQKLPIEDFEENLVRSVVRDLRSKPDELCRLARESPRFAREAWPYLSGRDRIRILADQSLEQLWPLEIALRQKEARRKKPEK